MSIGMLGGSLGQGPLAAFCKSSGWRFAMSITSVVPIFVSVCTAIVYTIKSGRNNNENNVRDVPQERNSAYNLRTLTELPLIYIEADTNKIEVSNNKLKEDKPYTIFRGHYYFNNTPHD